MTGNRCVRTIAMVVPPGGEILDVTGPLGVFGAANRVLQGHFGWSERAYEVLTLGPAPGPVALSDGVQLVADRAWGRVRDDIDTLVIPGAADVSPMHDPRVVRWVQRMEPRVRRLVSVCTGALVLAEAGLLDGRRATTHWESCPRLDRYHSVTVVPDAIFVRDGDIWTSAGITAGIDLALALIDEDHGRQVAQATARELVVFLKRPGGQSQFSAHLLAQASGGDDLDALLEWILDNLDADLSVPVLAERAATSPRHLGRLFNARLNMTPATFVELARVDAARRQLEEPGATLQGVARLTGFGSVERLRRACLRRLGVLPSEYKRRNGVARSGERRTRVAGVHARRRRRRRSAARAAGPRPGPPLPGRRARR
jgi:transcriptional regulator GlxA family with amidase domain